MWGMRRCDGVVPGTVRLDAQDDSITDRKDYTLKHGTGTNSSTVLSPQPSDDPNDPLNWPQHRKDALLITISATAAVTNAIGPMISTAFRQIARENKVSLDTAVSAAGGSFSIAVGLTTFFSTAAAVKYGKRPLFVGSLFLLIFASVWAEFAPSLAQLAISRVLQGIAAAPFETLVTSTVADMYFVHERASRLAIWGLSVVLGMALSQVGGGYIVQYYHWKQLFAIAAVLFSILFVAILFGVPETAFNRVPACVHPMHELTKRRATRQASRISLDHANDDRIYVAALRPAHAQQRQSSEQNMILPIDRQGIMAIPQDRASIASSVYSAIPSAAALQDSPVASRDRESVYSATPRSSILRQNTVSHLEKKLSVIPESPIVNLHRESDVSVHEPPKSFWSLITFVPRTVYSKASFWKLAFRPFPLFIYPAVLFSSLVNGLNSTLLIAFGLASLTLFASEPYNLKPIGVGLTALPPVIAACIAQPMAGYLTDYLARTLTKKNNGIFEPEFRLLSMIPSTLFATIGFIGFGVSIHLQQVSGHATLWILLVWYSIIAFSIPWTDVAAYSYLIDSHLSVANEAFVTTHVVKAIMALVAAGTINGWIERHGARTVFCIIAGVNFGVSLATVVFWVFGKKMRAWVAQNEVLQNV